MQHNENVGERLSHQNALESQNVKRIEFFVRLILRGHCVNGLFFSSFFRLNNLCLICVLHCVSKTHMLPNFFMHGQLIMRW